jgi:hypothetical protein
MPSKPTPTSTPTPCALIGAYDHDPTLPSAATALHTLHRVGSRVKPLMRSRGWRIGALAEFYPAESRLLGLNHDGGQKICLRLRTAADARVFLPLEDVVDTMLHECVVVPCLVFPPPAAAAAEPS